MIQWVDQAGKNETIEWEPYKFAKDLKPNFHTNASCTQDGPILDVYLEEEPVNLYRQQIYHFHVIDDPAALPKPMTACADNMLGSECDIDLIRVCREDRQAGRETPCNDAPGGSSLSGPNGCQVCSHHRYAETPG
jgi:hypothetical protein